MALKAFLLLFVTILLVTTMVSSQDQPDEELKAKRLPTSPKAKTTPKAKATPKARSPPPPKSPKWGSFRPLPRWPPSPALDEPYPPFHEFPGDELTPPLPVAGFVNPLNKSVSSIGNRQTNVSQN